MPPSIALLILLATGASAQYTPSAQSTQAMRQLEDASAAGLGPVADGGERSGDGTAVASETKGVLLKTRHVRGQRICRGISATAMGGSIVPGPEGLLRDCSDEPPYTENLYGDRKTIRIVDRERYVGDRARSGAGWGALVGGLLGGLGFLAFLIPGIGTAAAIGIGLAAVAVGAGAGAAIGRAIAAHLAVHKPAEWTEEDVTRRDVSFP